MFTSPKPFVGRDGENQMRALRSWVQVADGVEVIVFGDSLGAAEAARAVGAKYERDIVTSPTGAPSFNSMAEIADATGRYELQAYVNADILLAPSFAHWVKSAAELYERMLVVGERLDLVEGVVLDVENGNWLQVLSSLCEERSAVLHGPTGTDYFAFKKGAWRDLPPVFMGRAMCDQALLHFAFRTGLTVVDATQVVAAVHQYHGYSHVAGGKTEVFRGADYRFMSEHHGLRHALPTIADADVELGRAGAQRGRRRGRRLRDLEMRVRYQFAYPHVALVLRALAYLAGRNAVIPRQFSEAAVVRSWANDVTL